MINLLKGVKDIMGFRVNYKSLFHNPSARKNKMRAVTSFDITILKATLILGKVSSVIEVVF